MELLLNLIWVLLAVPAFWLWRHEAMPAGRNRYLTPGRYVLVLGFALLMLFPVISATDDLRAMQPETEESSARRVSRNAENEKDPIIRLGAVPALLGVSVLIAPLEQFCGLVLATPQVAPFDPAIAVSNGRAPPAPVLV
jgi:hypothetical protein